MLLASLSLTNVRYPKMGVPFIEELTQNAGAVQEKVLTDILTRNAKTEYLGRFGLVGGGPTDRKTFKSNVPVITYEDIQPHIQRIANGDRSPILSGHPITELLASSGTSGGERKLIPTIQEDQERRVLYYSLVSQVINSNVPGLEKGKSLSIFTVRPETMSPGGLPVQAVMTSYYKSQRFKSQLFDPSKYASPYEAIVCPDSFQSLYAHMLCALLNRHSVLRISAVFASSLLHAIHFLTRHWGLLAHDIETGILNPGIVDPSLRDCLKKILRPDASLAEFLRKECEGENWERIIRRLWPNAKVLDVIITGSMAQYIPMLEHYSGGLPVASMTYGSSESFLAINLNPMCKPSEISYTLMPFMAYYEFLPQKSNSLECIEDCPSELVDLVDVEVGKEYEIVLTTYSGLCRYRLGDVLRVDKFYNSAPEFTYVRRKNMVLSVDTDKTDETDLQKAVENASRLLHTYDARVVEYTSYADTSSFPGHYVIYWELLVKNQDNSPTRETLNRCCHAMEESLDREYRGLRANKALGPLEIRVVKNGTFQEMMEYAITRGASINQYKVPRCVKFKPFLELLESRVVSTHFSPSTPSYTIEERFN